MNNNDDNENEDANGDKGDSSPETESASDSDTSSSDGHNNNADNNKSDSKNPGNFFCEICNKMFKWAKNFNAHRVKCKPRFSKKNIPPFPEDPVTKPLEIGGHLAYTYAKHWRSIRTHYFEGKVQRMYNIRWENDGSETPDWEQVLSLIFERQTYSFKITASTSLMLQHQKTGEIEYFHPSYNNHRVFDDPVSIQNRADLDDFIEKITNIDFFEKSCKERASTEWDVVANPSTSFYVYPIPPFPLGCSTIDIPQHIIDNKNIITLTGDGKKKFTDNLCLFRALSLLDPNANPQRIEKPTKDNFERYAEFMNIPLSEPFQGIDDINSLEEFFNVNINIYSYEECEKDENEDESEHDLNDDDDDDDDIPPLCAVRRSDKTFTQTLHLLKVKNHVCFIKDVAKISHCFTCSNCDKSFTHYFKLNAHSCAHTFNGQRESYPGGVFQPTLSTLSTLRRNGLPIPENFMFPHRITFDFESYFKKSDKVHQGKQTQIINTHVPLSFSIVSNVPGHTEAKCIISKGNEQELIDSFISEIETISKSSYEILKKQFEHIFDILEERINSTEHSGPHYDNPSNLKDLLEEYIRVIPVVGFNSGRYDLNVIKTFLFRKLNQTDTKIKYILKTGNTFKAIATESFIFLDIKYYLAPGYSYSQYLAAYDVKETKGFFPYEYMDDIQKLDDTALPPHSAFYSSLKNENITVEEYQFCQNVWQEYADHARFSCLVQQQRCCSFFACTCKTNSVLQNVRYRYVER